MTNCLIMLVRLKISRCSACFLRMSIPSIRLQELRLSVSFELYRLRWLYFWDDFLSSRLVFILIAWSMIAWMRGDHGCPVRIGD
uniref:Uncharacterized protein n=1 Tax=Arundo donax TaxID=35708 RepID=A0A0A9EB05_ARUDO